MATTMLTHSRMVFAFDNYFVASRITGITLVNCSAATGSSVTNLLYEDPYLTLRTTTPTGNPEIKFQATSNWTVAYSMLGFLNQNFWHNYDELLVYVGSAVGGPWTEVGRVDLNGSTAESFTLGNPDLLMEMPTTSTLTWMRLLFTKASAWPALEIGNVVFMQKYECTTNPTVDSFSGAFERAIPVLDSVGGALHTSRGLFPRRSVHNYQFTRIDDLQSQMLFDLYSLYGDKWVGVIPPSQSAKVLPYGFGHHFSRITRCNIAPRQGTTAALHKNDVQLQMPNVW